MSIHTRYFCGRNGNGRIRVLRRQLGGKLGSLLVVHYDHALSAHENHMRAAAKAMAEIEGAPKLSDCCVGESESGRGYTVTWGIAYSAGADNV